MKKRAFSFPGQGAQYVGMAKDFYDTDADCKAVIDAGADALDFDLRAVLFEPNELINKTEYTQAAMLAAEVCALEAVKKAGAECVITAGLSLGEYAALVACGAMDYTDAMKVVRKRGMYMESAVPAGKGGMSAIIGLPADVVEEGCRKAEEETGLCVVPANYNCPGQIVVSGDKAVWTARARYSKKRARSSWLRSTSAVLSIRRSLKARAKSSPKCWQALSSLPQSCRMCATCRRKR